ncbi:hypothetical protein AVEN_160087-1 [Araneus ventricosus]|uniref:Uncharacterized protein n=1 Tax=Araneus ventricosus TaxID=182803 RepID=A0A4Y2GI08_ARAVE|nr:hypothetical protein AVEN_160087-1 [Araneus ventricosus]
MNFSLQAWIETAKTPAKPSSNPCARPLGPVVNQLGHFDSSDWTAGKISKGWESFVKRTAPGFVMHQNRQVRLTVIVRMRLFVYAWVVKFGNSLRRYALPLMMQAGKYLGKPLLTSGRNIIEDVSQGKSFLHAARDQIRQSGREITADVLRKLRGGGGVKRKKSMRSRQKKRQKLSPRNVFSDL